MMGDALVKMTEINKEEMVGFSLGCSNCEMEFRFLRGERKTTGFLKNVLCPFQRSAWKNPKRALKSVL